MGSCNNEFTMILEPCSKDHGGGIAARTYRIVAAANGYGMVTVPVTIAAGQTTILHLQGGSTWPNQAAFNQTNAVRLPDGGIVGWKSTVAMK